MQKKMDLIKMINGNQRFYQLELESIIKNGSSDFTTNYKLEEDFNADEIVIR